MLKEMFKWFVLVVAFWQRPKKPRRFGAETRARGKDIEETGRWYYLRDILDHLDDYLLSVKHLRDCDSDSYDFYSRVGGCVAGPEGIYNYGEMTPLWRTDAERPSFGMCQFAMAKDDRKDWTSPRCMYFRKLSFAGGVQLAGETLYSFVWFFDDRKGTKFRGAYECHVNVDRDGIVTPLRERVRVPCYGKKNRRDPVCHKIEWRLPEFLERDPELPKKQRKKLAREKWLSAEDVARNTFIFVTNMCETATADIRVSAEKNGLPAIFSVDLLRTPYFFQDRDKVMVNGRAKRIFHIVRTHERRIGRGRRVYVRSHFRGLRRFMWHGYKVTITMPGFHHFDPMRFGVPGWMVEGNEKPPGTMGSAAVGDMLREGMDV